MISKKALDQLKDILLKDYGWKVDDKTATQLANNFLTSLEAIQNRNTIDKLAERSKSND